MKNVDVLMLSPMMPLIMEGIGQAFNLHKAWEAPDRDALIAELAPRIRGLAPGSHYHVDGALMDKLPKLEIIANFGVGYDTVDAAEAGRRGVIVTNTPDVLTEEVADLAVGLLIATVRQLPQVDRYLRAGKWLEKAYPLTATLRGRKIGILGLGRIGKAVAKRLEAFGLEIGYHGRKPAGGRRRTGTIRPSSAWRRTSTCSCASLPAAARPRAWSMPRSCARSVPTGC